MAAPSNSFIMNKLKKSTTKDFTTSACASSKYIIIYLIKKSVKIFYFNIKSYSHFFSSLGRGV
jgi:hypothetical protein